MPTVTVIQPTKTEEKSRMIRCAAYCRVSSDSEDQINSFMAQLKYYENFLAESKTETLINVYADEGVTGTREDKREDFQRMMKDCRKGKIDRIYTKSISRFARNTKDCLKNIRELKSLGITVFFEKENIDTANMPDEMMITIMGGLAQEESVSISQNMRWSIKKRMENGTMKMCTDVFGYELVNGELIIKSDEAEIVRQIFAWYLSGSGTAAIAKLLNEKNVQKHGKSCHWTPVTIKKMLTNEKYVGDQLFQKKYTTDTLPFRQVVNKGEKNQYYYSERHEPIISRETFEKVRQLLYEHKDSFKGIRYNHIMSKKIYCGNCGATYKLKRRNNKSYWVCRIHDAESHKCYAKQVLETRITSAFIRLFNKLFYNYKQILVPLQAALQDLKIRRFRGNSNVMEIHKEIAKFKEQTHVLARLKTKGFLDNAKYLEQTSELNSKVSKLQSEIKKITHLDDEDETLEQIEMLIDYFEKQCDPISKFDESAFEFMIEKIVVISQNEMEFHIIGGLKLTEKIC